MASILLSFGSSLSISLGLSLPFFDTEANHIFAHLALIGDFAILGEEICRLWSPSSLDRLLVLLLSSELLFFFEFSHLILALQY